MNTDRINIKNKFKKDQNYRSYWNTLEHFLIHCYYCTEKLIKHKQLKGGID